LTSWGVTWCQAVERKETIKPNRKKVLEGDGSRHPEVSRKFPATTEKRKKNWETELAVDESFMKIKGGGV